MSMRIEYVRRSRLPRLAWYACIARDTGTVEVHHGDWLEANPGWFVDGVWSGPFEVGAFPEAQACTGFGAAIRGDTLLISTPTHTMDRLHLLRVDNRLFFSPSIALLFAATGDDCRSDYRYYMHDFSTITRGIRSCGREVPTADGNRIELYYYCNLVVDRDLNVRRIEKEPPPRFDGYAGYRAFLAETVSAVFANGRAPARRVKYQPIASVSAGYDSPAGAVLASEGGCRLALTFAKGVPRGDASDDDSGSEIAERLGLEVREFSREEYMTRQDMPEVEFMATGTGGDLALLSSWEKELEGKILITGDHGDTMWDRLSPRVSREIKRGDAGSSLVDYKARVGFNLLPVPFIGVIAHPEIHEISGSAEMVPFSMGRDKYDRPIARRIAEEAGVPREQFGQVKRVVAQAFGPTTSDFRPLENMLSPASLMDFRRFYDGRPRFRLFVDRIVSAVLRAALWINYRIIWRLQAVARALGHSVKMDLLISEMHYRLPPAPHNFTFHWAVRRMARKYAAALQEDPRGASDDPR